MKSMTGNRIILKIGGQAIGFAQEVSVTDETEMQKLYGLGDIEPVELVPGGVTYTITGSKYVVSTGTLRALGLVPEINDWMSDPGLSLEVIDQKGGAIIEHYTGCKFESHTRKYGKHTIVGEDFRLIARSRGFVAEPRQSQPEGLSAPYEALVGKVTLLPEAGRVQPSPPLSSQYSLMSNSTETKTALGGKYGLGAGKLDTGSA